MSFLKQLLGQPLVLAVILLIALSASPLRRDSLSNFLVVWNVGQGQWVTTVQEEQCWHFDVGGEFFPWKKLTAVCKKKENKIYLSHWDWDHIGALARWPSWSTCIALAPHGKSSKHKMKMLEQFSNCAENGSAVKSTAKQNLVRQWSPDSSIKQKDTNSASHVIQYAQFLIPGDSPRAQELQWKNTSWVPQSKVLILGHHGSRTSTSKELLEQLPRLTMAIASARWKRYKHPHAETESLLKQHHIALLRTEDWGSIWFEL